MNPENRIKIFNANDTEGLKTGEGIMSPFLFTNNVSLIHLELPAGTEVTPHSHPKEGLLYCLSGDLEVFSDNERFTISRGTAIVVPANLAVGVSNKSAAPVECLLISSPPTFKSLEELKERLRQIGAKKL